MKKGDYVNTPRFLKVLIEKVYDCESDARNAGFTEPTYYWNDKEYGVYGKIVDRYHMEFAAFRKEVRA